MRQLEPDGGSVFGVLDSTGEIQNPSGLTNNLLKILPEPIPIMATADTVEELKNTNTTALGRLKKEALVAFFEQLRVKTKEALVDLDRFLHGEEGTERSDELVTFEKRLQEEFEGEFADVLASVEFLLPTEEIIAKEMKIFLDDGYRSEVELKGHGLQRAALLALLKVLAKHGARYQNRPTPLFLIGELESFLHPFAQKKYAAVLKTLAEQYQIVTTTHSPFIIDPAALGGYRRVSKDSTHGARATAPSEQDIEVRTIIRHLDRRSNLEGLFADRVILVEGDHDEGCFKRLIDVLGIDLPASKYTLFVRAGGKNELRQCRRFYSKMGFDDVSLLCDLDYLFGADCKVLLRELGVEEGVVDQLRRHIDWTEDGDPPYEVVVAKIGEKGESKELTELLATLREHRVFVLRHGAPEAYYKNTPGKKNGWMAIESKADLLYEDDLRTLLSELLS